MQTINIIVTDDHAIFRDGVRMGLAEKKDIRILGEAIHGQDLLNQLEYLRPDIILLGINMPVLNGLDTLPILKEKYPGIKIIMLTMYDDSQMICRTIELGANAYLTKNVAVEEIYQAIITCKKKWLLINDTLRNAIMEQSYRDVD